MLRDEAGRYGPLSLMELSGGLLTDWPLAFCSATWTDCALLVNQVVAQTVKMILTMTRPHVRFGTGQQCPVPARRCVVWQMPGATNLSRNLAKH